MERFHEIIGMFMPLVIALIALGASIYTQRSLRRREAEAKAEAKADALAETLRREAKEAEETLRREAKEDALRREIATAVAEETRRREVKEEEEVRKREVREDALRREAEAKEAAHIRKEFLIGVIMNRNLSKAQREPFMDEYRKSGNNGTIIEFWEREE
jgi:hypothetical protein